MTTSFLALLGATTALGIVACFVLLYAIRIERGKTPLGLLKAIESELDTWAHELAKDRLPLHGEANGIERSTVPWWNANLNETTTIYICPTCGTKSTHRAGRQSNGVPGDLHSDPGDGAKHDDRLSWFHYISRDNIPAWEALGWKVKEIGPPHDSYSILGEWTGDGPPIKP